MSALHDVRVASMPLLEAALGVRAAIERFDDLLEHFAPPSDGAGDESDDAWTEIVLGAISVRNQLASLLDQRSSPDAGRSPAAVPLRGLLR